MRRTREQEEVEEPVSARGRRAGQAAWRRPRQRMSRRKPAILWTASIIGALAAIVVVASLVGHYVLAGGLGATPTTQLAVTPGPDLPVRHVQQPDLRDLNRALDTYISHMSLDEELGQMMQVHFGVPNSGPYPSIPADWLPVLQQYQVGSMILYWFNVQSASQVKALTSSMQARDIAPNIPLMIGMDEEGGFLDYLAGIYGRGPTEWSLGAGGDPQKAYDWGKQDAQHLKDLGINTDFAPVVDVGTLDSYLGDRMYSDDPQVVATMASAFIDGLHSEGVPDSLKHWPGFGSISVDPHASLPTSNRTLADLEKTDFVPYKALIDSGRADMIMPTHILLPAIDPNMPTSLSSIVIDGILRQQLGFQGVVITDALYMDALDKYSMGERAVLAVLAGNDILSNFYNPNQLIEAMNALHQAIQQGRITKARIDLSVKRILTLKMKYGLWTPPNYNG
jgi:beta-N-acetylhexosaminidase